MLNYQSLSRIVLSLTFLCFVSLPAKALLINKYDLPDVIEADAEKPELKLQGAAVRSWYLMVKGYIGALYLEEPTSSAEAIYASDSYQRMAFVMLVSKMSARRIANAFYESIQLNSPPDEQEAMKNDLETIFSLVDGSMKKGKGLRVEIAGVEKGVVPARKEVFNLFLRVWIGETPPTADKNGMSGKGQINVNQATVEQLDKGLLGVGPRIAMEIVKHRNQHGPYQSVEDLDKPSAPVLSFWISRFLLCNSISRKSSASSQFKGIPGSGTLPYSSIIVASNFISASSIPVRSLPLLQLDKGTPEIKL
ncbi:hypothetical protein CAPTEDRAFT_200303, partial [Capitella teleta]